MAERWLVPLVLAAMQVAWLAPWSYLAGDQTAGAPLLPPLVMFGLLVVAAWLTSRLPDRGEPSVAAKATVVAAGLLAALIATRWAPGASAGWPATLGQAAQGLITHPGQGLPFILLAFVGAGGLWWRGIALGRSRPGDRNVTARAGIGIAGLAVAAVVGQNAHLPADVLPLAVLAFLLAALLATALAQAEAVRGSSRDRQARRLGRSWLGFVASLALALLAIGVGVAAVTAQNGLALLEMAGRLVGSVLADVVYVLALPFLLAGELLYRLLLLLRPKQAQPPTQRPPSQSPFAQLPQQGTGSPPPAWLVHVVGVTIALSLLALLVLLCLLALRRLAATRDDADVPEERESVFAWDDLLAPLRSRLVRRGGTRSDRRVDAVRAAYRQFLALAAIRGLPRAPDETAQEFQERARSTFASAALARLTDRYERVRYGPGGVTPEDAAEAAAALRELEAAGSATRHP